jgi:acyl carrier protein
MLHGPASDLDGATPLLEWGIVDSLSIVDLVAFIEDRFAVAVLQDHIKPDNFRNLTALAELVTALRRQGG